MNIARFFIDRPVFAIVVSVIMVVAGALAALGLPVAQYPEIAPPTITITASFPGANAQTVADTVSTPIEEQVNGVEHMLYMSSQCANDGNMNLTVSFAVGTNLDLAQVEVQNRVAIAMPQLPQEVQRQGVTVKKASPDITVVVDLYSPDKRFDTVYLSNYATLQVRDEIARLPGVGDIFIFGARDYSMRLWLDPDKMAARDITAGDVVAAVREQNVQVAAGIVGGPPLPAGTTAFQYTISAQGRLADPAQFAQIIVKVGSDGRVARVADLGRVELGAADYSTAMTYNGQPAVGIAIFQLPGTNSISTANAVYRKMEELKARFPKGLEYSLPYDTTLYVRASIQDVVVTLLEGVGLVMLVVLLFLESWRAALVPMLAIPVSLVGTFAVMWVAGFSINMLTLFGLVLAIGIVVDDAIVVVENVQRWIDEGLTPRHAAFKAMDEVTPAIIAIAFGLSAVFVPAAFISGITGQFYRQFALTIAFSTLLSAFNSLTLSPALAALLLPPRGARRDWLTATLDFLLGWFFRLFNRAQRHYTAGYAAVLRRVVRLSLLVLALYVGLVLLTGHMFRIVPTGFIPPQDQGFLFANLQMPDASALDRTQATLAKMVDITLKTPGVQNTVAVAGRSIVTSSNSSAVGLMFIILNPAEQRKGHPEQSAAAVLASLSAQYRQVQEGQALVFPSPTVRGIGTTGGFKMQVQDRSGVATPQQLQAATERLMAAARQHPNELQGLFSSFRAGVPQLYADVDRVKAKQQNVSVTGVFEALQVYLGSLYVNDFNYLGRTYRVIAQADSHFRANAKDAAQFKTRNQAGQMVPLGAVMTLRDTTGPDRINRYNLYLSAEINGRAAPGVSSGQAIALMEDLAAKNLPPGFLYEWTDLAYQEKAAGDTAFLIFPLCIMLVWLVHSAEYESFALSTAIILIVPMCLLCGITGVHLRGLDNNIFTQIGFLVLAGMSVKNAVLIVEFAKQQQEHHPELAPRDAAIEASRLRLRPILMTSFALIFGVLPLVFASGPGSEMRRALGTVVFYGMIGVTFFGIFLTPVFFTAIRWVLPHKPHPAPPTYHDLHGHEEPAPE
jgi:hydrophobe/amphiphile efflux-1 (HAE1) family protein